MHGEIRDPWEGLRGNLLLASLPAREALLVAPSLRRVHLSVGEPLGDEIGTASALVYFPETVVIGLGLGGSGRDALQVGLVGREGMIGWTQLLGSADVTHEMRVQLRGGTALAMPASRLAELCLVQPSLSLAMLRFAHLFAVQMASTMISNLHDSIESRLSRWLLMFHDRHFDDELAITHDTLSTMLNVRRASVTDALHLLEGELLLRCTRGRVMIRDRAALERRAASGYGGAERSYRAMIGPFGKTA
jgi:CRP-like cAMP-binding protein